MRLQLRLLIIMVIALLSVSGFLVLQYSFDLQRSNRLIANELQQHKQYFAANHTALQQPLKTISEDYSFWDEMVTFVQNRNPKFARDNIDTGISTFDADAAAVYDAQGKSIYVSQADTDNPVQIPMLPAGYFTKLKTSKFDHFYVRQADSVLEVRAATIVPGDDPEHRQPARGYWIVVRQVGEDYLKQLADLSQSKVELNPASASADNKTTGATLSSATQLPGWDGKPVAVLRSTSTVSVITDLNDSYRKQILLLSTVGIVLVILVVTVIWLWVLRPIKRISLSLKSQRPELLSGLSGTNSEFGSLARTVQDFYAQKVTIQEAEIKRLDLERLNQEKSDFLKVAAHELKGPISIIKLLSTDLPTNEKVWQDRNELNRELNMVTHQTNKLEMLINDLRMASLGHATNDLELKPVEFNFDELLRKEVEANQFITQQKILLSGETRQKCLADPERIGQVISNLIRNATKYSPNTDSIEVRASVREGWISFEVADHGIGISEEDQKHIFERYYRAESVKQGFQGLGLGLSICRHIVEQSGGKISVRSVAGQGTTMTVMLPAVAELNEQAEHETEEPQKPEYNG